MLSHSGSCILSQVIHNSWLMAAGREGRGTKQRWVYNTKNKTLRNWRYERCVLRPRASSTSVSTHSAFVCCPVCSCCSGSAGCAPGVCSAWGCRGLGGLCRLCAEHPPHTDWNSATAARAFAFRDHAAASVQLCLPVIKYSIIN